MGAQLSKNDTTKISNTFNNIYSSSCRNKRTRLEDREFVSDLNEIAQAYNNLYPEVKVVNSSPAQFTIRGVIDGHGDESCAEILANNFVSVFEKTSSYQKAIASIGNSELSAQYIGAALEETVLEAEMLLIESMRDNGGVDLFKYFDLGDNPYYIADRELPAATNTVKKAKTQATVSTSDEEIELYKNNLNMANKDPAIMSEIERRRQKNNSDIVKYCNEAYSMSSRINYAHLNLNATIFDTAKFKRWAEAFKICNNKKPSIESINAIEDMHKIRLAEIPNTFADQNSGACAAFHVSTPDYHIFAHVGDCGAILIRNNKFKYLTKDHKHTLPGEHQRIVNAGLFIEKDVNSKYKGRVCSPEKNCGINMTRAFGDFTFKRTYRSEHCNTRRDFSIYDRFELPDGSNPLSRTCHPYDAGVTCKPTVCIWETAGKNASESSTPISEWAFKYPITKSKSTDNDLGVILACDGYLSSGYGSKTNKASSFFKMIDSDNITDPLQLVNSTIDDIISSGATDNITISLQLYETLEAQVRLPETASEINTWSSQEVSNYLYNTKSLTSFLNFGPKTNERPFNMNINGTELLKFNSKEYYNNVFKTPAHYTDDSNDQNMSLVQLSETILDLHPVFIMLVSHLQLEAEKVEKFRSHRFPNTKGYRQDEVLAVTRETLKYLRKDINVLYKRLKTAGSVSNLMVIVRNIFQGVASVTTKSVRNFIYDLSYRNNGYSEVFRNKSLCSIFSYLDINGEKLEELSGESDLREILTPYISLSDAELDNLWSNISDFISRPMFYETRDPTIVRNASTRIQAAARKFLTKKQTQRRYYAIHTLQSWFREIRGKYTINYRAYPPPNIYTIKSDVSKEIANSCLFKTFTNTMIPCNKLNL